VHENRSLLAGETFSLCTGSVLVARSTDLCSFSRLAQLPHTEALTLLLSAVDSRVKRRGMGVREVGRWRTFVEEVLAGGKGKGRATAADEDDVSLLPCLSYSRLTPSALTASPPSPPHPYSHSPPTLQRLSRRTHPPSCAPRPHRLAPTTRRFRRGGRSVEGS
jgi:hypothetical protein